MVVCGYIDVLNVNMKLKILKKGSNMSKAREYLNVLEEVPNKQSKSGYADFESSSLSDQDAENIIMSLGVKGYTFSSSEDDSDDNLTPQKVVRMFRERSTVAGWGFEIHREGDVVGAITDNGEDLTLIHGDKELFNDLKDYEIQSPSKEDIEDELAAYQRLMYRISKKNPVGLRSILYSDISDILFGIAIHTPGGKTKIINAIKQFKKEHKI